MPKDHNQKPVRGSPWGVLGSRKAVGGSLGWFSVLSVCFKGGSWGKFDSKP